MNENNFKLNKSNLNEIVTLSGWINKIRKMGELIFLDLRGENGIVQVIFDKKNDFFDEAAKLNNDDIITISGKIVERKNKNSKIFSGDIEIIATNLKKIFSLEYQLPVSSNEESTALEQIRMEYRYLDLRRSNIYNIFKTRSIFNKYTRMFFDENKFLEIETPYLTKPTYGGASELKVTSKHHKDKEFSLIQSPQIYKQLLMYGGFERYYQIVKCFRDEDSRADRQLEFTQLDLEASFIDEEYIYNLIEKYLESTLNKVFKKKISIPFKRISYNEAIQNYGSDKPDLRFENTIIDFTDFFKSNSLYKIKKDFFIKGISFNHDNNFFTGSKIKNLQEKYENKNIKFLYIWIKDKKIVKTNLKEFDDKINISFLKKIKAFSSFSIFLYGENEEILKALGELRIDIAKKLEIIPKDEFNFSWVVDWPLFLKNDDGKIESSHNPFVELKNPKDFEKLNSKNKDIFSIMSKSYDLILNGNEIGGGSIRISDFKIQEEIFKVLGLSKEEIERDFEWLLRAQKYGTPIHGGIALGIDRILAILLGKNSIREVIAFPKTSHGTDELSGAPTKK